MRPVKPQRFLALPATCGVREAWTLTLVAPGLLHIDIESHVRGVPFADAFKVASRVVLSEFEENVVQIDYESEMLAVTFNVLFPIARRAAAAEAKDYAQRM